MNDYVGVEEIGYFNQIRHLISSRRRLQESVNDISVLESSAR